MATSSNRTTAGRMTARPVYIVDGARTPFLKARTGPGPFRPSDLAVHAGQALLARQPFAPDALDEVILGCIMPGPEEANIARVVSLRPRLRRPRAGMDRAAQLCDGHAGHRLCGAGDRRRALGTGAGRWQRSDEPRAGVARRRHDTLARRVGGRARLR